MPNGSGAAPPTDHAIPVLGSSEDVLGAAAEPTDDCPTIISKNSPKPALLNNEGIRGRRLAHFELLEQIGVGGMAAVLRARDTQLDRIVALKILPPDMATDPENVLRFHQEARSAAKLDHENIARVFFCGEDQRLHFIAFEFVEGDNLRTILEHRGRLPVGEALPYVLQVAAGLGSCRRARRRPPRHQAVEHHHHAVGPGQARGHGPGPQPGAAAGRGPDAVRRHPRHLRLHLAGAGPGAARRRRAQRHLFARLHVLSHDDGPGAGAGGDGRQETAPSPARPADRSAENWCPAYPTRWP